MSKRWLRYPHQFSSSKDVTRLVSVHGAKGFFVLIRIIEELFENFDPDMPTTFVQDKKGFYYSVFQYCDKRTGIKILETLQAIGFFTYKSIGNTMHIQTDLVQKWGGKDYSNFVRKILENKSSMEK